MTVQNQDACNTTLSICNVVLAEQPITKTVLYLNTTLIVPEWVSCIAIDSDGKIYGYSTNNITPTITDLDTGVDVYEWQYDDSFVVGCKSVYIGKCDIVGDWTESKVEV